MGISGRHDLSPHPFLPRSLSSLLYPTSSALLPFPPISNTGTFLSTTRLLLCALTKAQPKSYRHVLSKFAIMGSELGARAEAPTHAVVDNLGTFYICFAVAWTSILVGCMVFLYRKRDMPIVRIRGLPLSFGAVILLHLYWLAVQTGYIYGPFMSGGVEFWIMGIWLPFGIALFHASNSRFLYVAEMQKRFIRHDTVDMNRRPGGKKTLLQRYRALDYTSKMLTLVCAGMGFQLFLTFFMFIISKKFHPSFGIDGTETHGTAAEKAAAAKVGWEWWPSVFWQFLWAWVVAPIILWRARNLHDSLGWRVQTIGCCLAGLHATPMWLVALYVPEMAVVNQYWIPPQWIAITIMLLEIFTILLPCWEVLKHQSLRAETLESIARWEARNKSNPDGSIETGSSSYVSWKKPRRNKAASISSSSNNSILTMDALEHTLVKNPAPLQQFSALKDFSGENIAFLRRVYDWRHKYYAVKGADRKMSVISEKGAPASPLQGDIRAAFEEALRIYIAFISARGAEFQVNISSADSKKLAGVFEHAARIVYGEARSPDPALPFETPDWRVEPKSPTSSSQTAIAAPETPKSEETVLEDIRYWGEIPEEFGEDVFDDAEMSIKYLVLTNTWPKYVRSRRSMDSTDSLEASGHSA